MKKILTLLFVFVALTSCDKYGGKPRSFVGAYLYVGSIAVDKYRDENNNFGVIITPEIISSDYLYTSRNNRDKYDELCRKYDDMTYYKVCEEAYSPHIMCYASEYSAIDIMCNNDFDDQHPAGTSLKDLVLFRAISVAQYISSGYTGEIYQTIEKPLSEVTVDDTKLVIYMALIFTSTPTTIINGTYKFTVTVSTIDGRQITSKPSSAIIF